MSLASPYRHEDGRPVSPAESQEIKRRARAEAARKGHQNRRAGIPPQREPALDEQAAIEHIQRHWLTAAGNHPTPEAARDWAASWLYHLRYERRPAPNPPQARTRPARPTPTLLDRWMLLETPCIANTADNTPIRTRAAKIQAGPVAPPPPPPAPETAAASSEPDTTPEPVIDLGVDHDHDIPSANDLARHARAHGLERNLHRLAQEMRAPWQESLWTTAQRKAIGEALQHMIDNPKTKKGTAK